MPSRYKIILESVGPEARQEEAVSLLIKIGGGTRDDAQFWITNLPHTIVNTASQEAANNLAESFSNLGYVVQCRPLLPESLHQESETTDSQTTSSTPTMESLSLSSRSNKTSKGVSGSLWLIGIIILFFGLSLLGTFFILKGTIKPGKKDVKALLKKGNYNVVNSLLTKEIQQGNSEANTYLNRAIARISRIRQIGYKNNWKKHLTSRNWNDDIKKLRNYYVSKEGNAALTDLKKALTQDPHNPDICKWLGILYQERRELANAEKYFRKALLYKPDNVELLSFLGSIQIDKKHYQSADSSFTRALQREPKNLAILKHMGTLQLFYQKDTAKALRYYLRYMKLDAGVDFDRPVIREEVTKVLWNKYFHYTLKHNYQSGVFSEFESERRNITAKLQEHKTDALFWELGCLFGNRGMYQEAMLQWRQALQINPDRDDISRKLFRVQGALNLFSEARGTLQNAIDNNTATPEMYMALGIINKYYVEDKKSAKKNFKKYLSSGAGKYYSEAKLELQELEGK
ncbi:MAG: hypothetical protein HQK83_13935 [Fibrobacteria bacterium]|nr:hypothetical protein [Fibrobacteria bacterium]